MLPPSDLLDLAGKLQFAFEGEWTQRTVINRAYYAAFHHGLRYCVDHGWIRSVHAGADHGNVAASLRQHRSRMGQSFDELQNYRRHADYVLRADADRAAGEAQIALELARQILDGL